MEQKQLINFSVEDIQVFKSQSLALPHLKRDYQPWEIENFKQVNLEKKYGKYGIDPEKATLEQLFEKGKFLSEKMKTSLLELNKEFEKRRFTYINLIEKGTYSEEDPVDFFYWYYWVRDRAAEFGFVQPKSYINYGKKLYALRSNNEVWIVDDFKLRDKQGKFTLKWNLNLIHEHNSAVFGFEDETDQEVSRASGEKDHQLTGKEIVENYCLLFRLILKGLKIYSHDFFVWNVMKMVHDQIILHHYKLSPRDVYAQCFKLMSGEGNTIRYPKQYKNTARKQELYLQPGYEEQGRYNYHEFLRNKERQAVYSIIHDAEIKGEILTLDDIWKQACLLNVFLKRHKNSNVYERYDPRKRDISKLIKEVQNDERFPKFEVKCLIKRKEHKQHKQQERSLWHSLVNLEEKSGINFSKIKEKYPNVTSSAYRKFRSELKKSLNENKE